MRIWVHWQMTLIRLYGGRAEQGDDKKNIIHIVHHSHKAIVKKAKRNALASYPGSILSRTKTWKVPDGTALLVQSRN
jgi:hypothetical protein